MTLSKVEPSEEMLDIIPNIIDFEGNEEKLKLEDWLKEAFQMNSRHSI